MGAYLDRIQASEDTARAAREHEAQARYDEAIALARVTQARYRWVLDTAPHDDTAIRAAGDEYAAALATLRAYH